MKQLIVLCLALQVCAGCASEAKYGKRLDSWVGHTEDELVLSWGPPTQRYPLKDGHLLVYSNSATGPVVYQQVGWAVMGNQATYFCNTRMQIDATGKIIGWSTYGNSCISN